MGRNNLATVGQRNPLPFVARGALGGAIVGFIMLLVSVITYKITLGYVPYAYLFIIPGLPMALGFGALVGVLIGTSVWILSVISGRTFGSAGRAIIGFVTALIIVSLYAYLHTEEPGYYHATLTWTRKVFDWFLSGVLLGVLPGMMARQKSTDLCQPGQT
jgi:hypothetical protein